MLAHYFMATNKYFDRTLHLFCGDRVYVYCGKKVKCETVRTEK